MLPRRIRFRLLVSTAATVATAFILGLQIGLFVKSPTIDNFVNLLSTTTGMLVLMYQERKALAAAVAYLFGPLVSQTTEPQLQSSVSPSSAGGNGEETEETEKAVHRIPPD